MWIVVAAWLAAFLVFSSFFMKTIVPLRIVAMVSNVAFIVYGLLGLAYGAFGRVYPILVLHSCLLPLNIKGDILFRQGEPADRLYLLQSGQVGFSELDKHVSREPCSAKSVSSRPTECVPSPPCARRIAASPRSAVTGCSSSTTRTRSSASSSSG